MGSPISPCRWSTCLFEFPNLGFLQHLMIAFGGTAVIQHSTEQREPQGMSHLGDSCSVRFDGLTSRDCRVRSQRAEMAKAMKSFRCWNDSCVIPKGGLQETAFLFRSLKVLIGGKGGRWTWRSTPRPGSCTITMVYQSCLHAGTLSSGSFLTVE